MRKISYLASESFMNHEDFRQSNTEVFQSLDGPTLSLHGSIIARLSCDYDKEVTKIYITNAGYFTNVTKERLNALPGVSIYQKVGKWYLNGTEWDGSWTSITL